MHAHMINNYCDCHNSSSSSSSWPASVILYLAHYWVVVFHPKTATTRSLVSVPLYVKLLILPSAIIDLVPLYPPQNSTRGLLLPCPCMISLPSYVLPSIYAWCLVFRPLSVTVVTCCPPVCIPN